MGLDYHHEDRKMGEPQHLCVAIDALGTHHAELTQAEERDADRDHGEPEMAPCQAVAEPDAKVHERERHAR